MSMHVCVLCLCVWVCACESVWVGGWGRGVYMCVFMCVRVRAGMLMWTCNLTSPASARNVSGT